MLLFLFIIGVSFVMLLAIIIERLAERRYEPRQLVVTVNDDPQEFYV